METGFGMVPLEAIQTVSGRACLAEVTVICLDWNPGPGVISQGLPRVIAPEQVWEVY